MSPQGWLIPGRPARLHGIVRMSERYMLIGSSIRSPKRNAGVGVVADNMTSTDLKASLNSRQMTVRTLWALV